MSGAGSQARPPMGLQAGGGPAAESVRGEFAGHRETERWQDWVERLSHDANAPVPSVEGYAQAARETFGEFARTQVRTST